METESKLTIEKYFQKEKNPYEETRWTKSDVQITDDDGKPLFLQKAVEAPEFYSILARKIVASKYFYGDKDSIERESSVRQLVRRVCETIAEWGLKQGYFNKKNKENFHYELAKLCIDQRVAFNSPVWFNVGTHKYKSRKTEDNREEYIVNNRDRMIPVREDGRIVGERLAKKGEIIRIPEGEYHLYPQTSACFIQSVDDTMESIMELAKKEALLFRYGSGTGSDLSTLRSSREKLSGGGKPSGPLAYLVFYDKVAGIVKSGGKTRRAAKMDSLKDTHPDIYEFITAKSREEEKVNMLMDKGINWKEARDTVSFQNANVSVRISDEFMRAVGNDEDWQTIPVHNKELADKMPKYKAKELFRKIAEGTWNCGDPGVQYDDTINKWHTCKNSEPINASNPCSEYMFVNNSSCNLASLNLMSFINPNGSFNTENFKRAIRTLTIAQDLLYDNSSFPTKEIAENSHKFRPLGMGYSNLGALLMFWGLPYDSEEGRVTASAITSLLTSTVYKASIEMAKEIGPFEEFEKNKEPMLNVIKMHRDMSKSIDKTKLLKGVGLEKVVEGAEWDYDVEEGEKYGFRNAQATVLAPTGTISFMMDCSTTGIEPDIALVKYKLLTEGSTLKIVNYTVEPALRRLGYPNEKIKSILNHIEKNDTIEGSELKDEHLPIFDCSLKPKKGKRRINPMGHIKMMAAVQPFISGAISKTINLDKETTVEEIEELYKEAWKLGLKAVAIYRDRSKRYQPLSTEKRNLERKLGQPIRRKLPTTSKSIRHKFDVQGHEGYLHVGLYEDDTPGELFITMSKEGSTVGGTMDCFATAVSMGLQYGVSLKDMVKKFKNQRFEPYGLVREGHSEIHTATSIIDYIFNFLGKTFLDEEKEENTGKSKGLEDNLRNSKNIPATNNIKLEGEPGGFCIKCGTQMIKFGHCEQRCPNPECGYVDYAGCGG